MKKVALITGIAGQDGSYLSEWLLEHDYKVYGIIRRKSTVEEQDSRIFSLVKAGMVETVYGDLLDPCSLISAVNKVEPNEVYNLASQSHVRISFDVPQFTAQVNAIGVINVLEAVKQSNRNIKFYQASSSEMFGNERNIDYTQDENTRMNPVSPYGCAKVFGYNMTRHYRRAYNIFACNGILFNHSSPRRGSNFVEMKIAKGAVEIKKGLKDFLELGNLNSERDIGHSKDYMRAVWLILQHRKADDFIIATGKTRLITTICQSIFSMLDLDWEDYVKSVDKYKRPEELRFLRGNPLKAKLDLGWKPEITFEELMKEIVDYWLNVYKDKSDVR